MFSGPSMRIGIDFTDVLPPNPSCLQDNRATPSVRSTTTRLRFTTPENSESSVWTGRTSKHTRPPWRAFAPRSDNRRNVLIESDLSETD